MATTLARIGILAAAAISLSGPARDAPSEATPSSDAMVRIPAGKFVQGRDDAERADERPAHVVSVASFDIDATLVTRSDFARFVAETGYATTAERIGYGIGSEEGMDDWAWQRIPHASWRRPFVSENDDSRAFLAGDAPVVMVSWDDANAYCTHFGRRLPTEAEWEYAMRAGAERTRYPWGDEAIANGHYRLNFWQGTSHHHNERGDGFVYVSTVRAFPPNAWGIYDAVGNVWQWTADVYDEAAYAHAPQPHEARPAPHAGTRVLRGGSWWCGACTCEGNGLFYRGK
ncbi:MAG: SUMF1/EgtB/PvdO family nonheme iron enzyme, partial [Polyangiaceae bacterium]